MISYEDDLVLRAPLPDSRYRTAWPRFWAGFVLWSSLAWWILEVATMLSHSKRRALHDFIAGTVVMRVTPPAV
jgi:uncharacterized RDD family membrane protein YckC